MPVAPLPARRVPTELPLPLMVLAYVRRVPTVLSLAHLERLAVTTARLVSTPTRMLDSSPAQYALLVPTLLPLSHPHAHLATVVTTAALALPLVLYAQMALTSRHPPALAARPVCLVLTPTCRPVILNVPLAALVSMLALLALLVALSAMLVTTPQTLVLLCAPFASLVPTLLTRLVITLCAIAALLVLTPLVRVLLVVHHVLMVASPLTVVLRNAHSALLVLMLTATLATSHANPAVRVPTLSTWELLAARHVLLVLPPPLLVRRLSAQFALLVQLHPRLD
jgi:hypothetical protein